MVYICMYIPIGDNILNTKVFIDVPRPLTNDLWVFILLKIDAECVQSASWAGISVYVKAFIVNVNKCLKPFFLEQHINIVNRVTLQSILVICTCYNSLHASG